MLTRKCNEHSGKENQLLKQKSVQKLHRFVNAESNSNIFKQGIHR